MIFEIIPYKKIRNIIDSRLYGCNTTDLSIDNVISMIIDDYRNKINIPSFRFKPIDDYHEYSSIFDIIKDYISNYNTLDICSLSEVSKHKRSLDDFVSLLYKEYNPKMNYNEFYSIIEVFYISYYDTREIFKPTTKFEECYTLYIKHTDGFECIYSPILSHLIDYKLHLTNEIKRKQSNISIVNEIPIKEKKNTILSRLINLCKAVDTDCEQRIDHNIYHKLFNNLVIKSLIVSNVKSEGGPNV